MAEDKRKFLKDDGARPWHRSGAADDGDLSKMHLTVAEFAKITGISKSTLIYYDNQGVFNPTMRGENNYRMYAPNQLTTVNQIRVLTDLGVPIKTLRTIVNDRTPDSILDLVATSIDQIKEQIEWLNSARKAGEIVAELIQRGKDVIESGEVDRVMLKELPERRLVIGPDNERQTGETFYKKFADFLAFSEENGYNASYPIGGLFGDYGAFRDDSSFPDNWFYVNPDGDRKRVAGRYVVGHARGYYGHTGDLVERMDRFIKDNGLTPTGPVYNVYLLDEISLPNQEDYLMQASVRVK
jgi:DNA-binding transcriptional MerR regulator